MSPFWRRGRRPSAAPGEGAGPGVPAPPPAPLSARARPAPPRKPPPQSYAEPGNEMRDSLSGWDRSPMTFATRATGESDVWVSEELDRGNDEWVWVCRECTLGDTKPADCRFFHPLDMVWHLAEHSSRSDLVPAEGVRMLGAQALYMEGFEGRCW